MQLEKYFFVNILAIKSSIIVIIITATDIYFSV